MSRSGDEKVSLVDLGRERPQVPATARNMSPIVPRASISGRALVAVVAIMTFLASLTTGTVLLVSASAPSAPARRAASTSCSASDCKSTGDIGCSPCLRMKKAGTVAPAKANWAGLT